MSVGTPGSDLLAAIEGIRARFHPVRDSEKTLLDDLGARGRGTALMGIRAAVLRAVVLESALIAREGLQPLVFEAIHVEGPLNLSSLEVACPLEFRRCVFDGVFDMSYASVEGIRFEGCSMKGLNGRGAALKGALEVVGQTEAKFVNVAGATVGGSIYFSDSKTHPAERPTLRLERCRVAGNVHVTKGAEINGGVRMDGCTIDGSLKISSSCIVAPGRVALWLPGVTIGGNLEILDSRLEGQLRMVGSCIKGGVVLSGDSLTEPGSIEMRSAEEDAARCCLYADGIDVGQDLMLVSGFKGIGEVRLMGAKIAGDLDCGGATIENRGGDALCATNITIGKNCFLDEGFKATGRVNFFGAKVGGVLRLTDARLEHADDEAALTLESASVEGYLRISRSVIADQVNLSKCQTGILDLGAIDPGGKTFLDLRQTRCKVLKDTPAAWQSLGRYNILGFQYDSLYMDDAWTLPLCLAWMQRANDGKFAAQPYEHLAKVQRSMGLNDDAREVLVAKEARRREGWNDPVTWADKLMRPARIARYLLEKHVTSFGYRPVGALYLAIVFWIVGAVIVQTAHFESAFFQAKGQGGNVSTGADVPVKPGYYPPLQPWIYSLEVLVPFGKFHQEEYWLPRRDSVIGEITQWYLWVHTAFGWLIVTLAASAATNSIKRE